MPTVIATLQKFAPDDSVTKGDAERLCKALFKRWPTNSFIVHLDEGKFLVRVIDLAPHDPIIPKMRTFADGFLASASLWER